MGREATRVPDIDGQLDGFKVYNTCKSMYVGLPIMHAGALIIVLVTTLYLDKIFVFIESDHG
jgi:hypothetical protein